QWGCTANSLPPEIIRRLPVRFVFDNNYFNDSFQGIPEGGYNVLTDSRLDGIEVRLSEDFFEGREEWMKVAKKVVFSGPIDRFFDYCFGHLPYRSLRFEHLEVEESNFQGNAVVNYTEADVPYTRIIEHKHFETFGEDVYRLPHTLITKEYPAAWTPGAEPFYPINTPEANACHERYKQLAAQQDRVIFGGRLADYRYYDMAPTIRCALDAARKEAQ
ncbi:MAG: UDP-galactopyranose mutase, partial [Bacteroidales bacterium]|nr:UDP-galactopyranose mutase [Bacteroidales bacterium]